MTIDTVQAADQPAVQAWRAYNLELNGRPDALLQTAEWLRIAGDLVGADDVLAHAVALFPEREDAAVRYGDLAIARGEWAAAAVRFARVRERFPESPFGYVYGGWASYQAKSYDEADAALSRGMEKFPDHPWIAVHYAWSALSRRDWNETARRSGLVRQAFPDMSVGYTHEGWALIELKRFEEADVVLRQAVERFPGDLNTWFHYARNALLQQLWREAVTRWEGCRDALPDDPGWKAGLGEALHAAEFHGVGRQGTGEHDLDDAPPAPVSPVRAADLPADELLLRFEGLGGGCEFGLIQRQFGAEPIGLLRFGYVPDLPFLLDALATRFDGVGEPENTSAEIFQFNGEYLIQSTKGFAAMHTHIHESSGMPLDDFIKVMLPRLKFMKGRILKSLEEGSKIWVFKRYDRLNDDEVVDLGRALAKHGPNRLLCIRLPDGEHEEGDVIRLGEDVAVGYVDFQAVLNPENPMHHDAWLEVCRKTLDMLPPRIVG